MKLMLLYLQFILLFLVKGTLGESTTTISTDSDDYDGESITYEAPSFQPPNLLTMAQAAIQNCYSDDNKSEPVIITDAGLRGLLNGERSQVPRNTKCLRYCIMRKNQLFNDDDIFNFDNMHNFFKNLHIHELDDAMLAHVVASCNGEAMKENDRCERAHIASVCILEYLNGE